MGDPLSPLQVSHAWFLFAVIPLYMVAAYLRPKFTKVHWKLHLIRNSLGYVGGVGLYASAAWIPLTDATALSFLNPIFTMLLAIPLLGEKVGPWRWVAAVMALIGASVPSW
ncbi:MAG: EamA family transporter [Planktomarina sp.]